MAEISDAEKTIPASPRKREKAREQGNFAQSQDLDGSIALVAGLLMLTICGGSLYEALMRFMHAGMANLYQSGSPVEFLRSAWMASLWPVITSLGTILAPIIAASLAYLLWQGGFHICPDVMSPNLERLDPMAGFQRLFSFQAVIQTVLGLTKLIAVSWVAFLILGALIPASPSWMRVPLDSLFSLASQLSLKLSWSVAIPLVLMGVADYIVRHRRFEKEIMMTKDEAKEEQKQLEGDPMIKHRVRSIQRQQAIRRMMHAVPKATVVITNPTHVAIALRYEAGITGAPVVVAKGEHLVAARIREIAAQHGVPIIERPPLARALLKAVAIGQEIPIEFYRVVAEVLALVYRQQGRAGRAASAAGGRA